MTEFRVLPIRCGDSYLIRSGGCGDFLFDGGQDGCGLHELLEERKVRKLRAVFCTNTCRERLGGILDLMETGMGVTEYWFPESLDLLMESARRFDGDWQGWLAQGSNGKQIPYLADPQWNTFPDILPRDSARRRMESVAMLIALGMTLCLGETPYAHLTRDSFIVKDNDEAEDGLTKFFISTLETLSDRAACRWQGEGAPVNRAITVIGKRLMRGGTTEDVAHLCGRLLLAEADLLPGGAERGVRSLVTTLALTAIAGALILKSPARVRFMSNADCCQYAGLSRVPVKCINGCPAEDRYTLPDLMSPKEILEQARQTIDFRNGLVYQYGNRDCGVLLCGDTRLPFLGNGEALVLDRPTIIAAPRQGGPSTERAYAHIHADDPNRNIWVRTHYSTARKVATSFSLQPNKLCLNNCGDTTLQEILIRRTNGNWEQVSGGRCARC
ncbi:hypothetical protein [Pseudodesulfovibrio sp. zrk46]|uniref:hypothetical protein n=1 Tax=Pseudodesulfovibrio sp. zrk46 TaxID=2725288 RepID=UPI0014498775|nr:hypothetical protein [Pseudodesulfovibrio sp. zrk46]QJB56210.1 hypothetical protein HFN16_07200 [Pseudodesulfovibrio sp. zrk46]